jgi:hypothetical protein
LPNGFWLGLDGEDWIDILTAGLRKLPEGRFNGQGGSVVVLSIMGYMGNQKICATERGCLRL